MKPWLKRIGYLPLKANAGVVFAMEDVLSVDQRECPADTILVCLNETSKQQTKDTRVPFAVRSGQAAIYDFEY